MVAPDVEQPTAYARFYTSIRRLPIYIGKLGKTRLPGGPYTIVQLIVAGAVLFIGYNTMELWGPLVGTLPLVRLIALLAITIGVAIASGKIPSTRRKLHHIITGLVMGMTRPVAGRINGRPVRLPKPHIIRSDVFAAELPADVDDFDGIVTFTREMVRPQRVAAARRARPARAARPTRAVPRPLIPRRIKVPTPTLSPAVAPAAPAVAAAASDPPRRFTSGMDRLLEQARTKES